MNKYDRLFEEILAQTEAGQLQWKQVSRRSNSDLILNPHLVFRQYATPFQRGGEVYDVVLVEKKFPDQEYDFSFEPYRPEVLILNDGELITTLTNSFIDRSKMDRLMSTVETTSDKAVRLFSSAG